MRLILVLLISLFLGITGTTPVFGETCSVYLGPSFVELTPYSGTCKDGRAEGRGQIGVSATWGGQRFEGVLEVDFQMGIPAGQGTFAALDGRMYFEGEFLNGSMWQGSIRTRDPDGNFQTTELRNGAPPQAECSIKTFNAYKVVTPYVGGCRNGLAHGFGRVVVEFVEEGRLKRDVMEGNFVDGVQEGEGVLNREGGYVKEFTGVFRQGAMWDGVLTTNERDGSSKQYRYRGGELVGREGGPGFLARMFDAFKRGAMEGIKGGLAETPLRPDQAISNYAEQRHDLPRDLRTIHCERTAPWLTAS